MRRFIVAGLAASALGLPVATPALAFPTTAGLDGGTALVTQVQFHGHGYRHGFHRGGGYYHHRRGFGGGAAIGAGVAGLAAGAVIGGALANSQAQPYPYPAYDAPPPPPNEGDAVAYCEQRFKSYDPSSGTYLGYDGDRHPCP